MSQDINRRELLVLGGAIAAAMCVGMSVTPAQAADADAGTVDVGSPDDFKDGISDKFAKSGGVFVVREGGKIYATSSYCTHKRNLLKVVDGQIRCPAHGSRFSNDGKSTKGPATVTIPRFALSKNVAGHLVVDKSKKFEESGFSDPASFITVP